MRRFFEYLFTATMAVVVVAAIVAIGWLTTLALSGG